MSRGRTAAIAVAFIAMISLWAACSSGSSKSNAAKDKQAAAKIQAATKARNKAAVANRNRKIAAARQRKAYRAAARTAAVRRRAAARRKPARLASANASPGGDLSAIQGTVTSLNSAFSTSVRTGIANSELANYWVGAKVYTSNECASFESARGQGIVAEAIVVHPETLRPAPGWVDPVIGRVPQGRIYRMAIDEIQTLVPTGQQRQRSFPIHVTIRPDGKARLFLRCA